MMKYLFSLEGSVEMAWMMGLIKYHSGPLKGKPYNGWVDAETNVPVDKLGKYEEHILDHTTEVLD